MWRHFGPLAFVLVNRDGQGDGLPGATAVLDFVLEADAVRAALLLRRGERTRPIVQLDEFGSDADLRSLVGQRVELLPGGNGSAAAAAAVPQPPMVSGIITS